jgi:hypothetical protein
MKWVVIEFAIKDKRILEIRTVVTIRNNAWSWWVSF